MIPYEAIWADLFRALDQDDDDVGPAPKWTVLIKRTIARPFLRLPHTSSHGAPPEDENRKVRNYPEYLVDVAISADTPGQEDSDLGYSRLLLAAEVEWNPHSGHLDYDFAKLADLRADRKVFVGGVNTKAPSTRWDEVTTPGGIIHRFARFLAQHELVPVGEEYLVVLSAYGKLRQVEREHSAAWVITKAPRMSPFERLESPPAD